MSRFSKRTLLPRFEARLSTDWYDRTFDIVCLSTDRVVLSLPFWGDAHIVKREAKLMVKALNQCFDRGGYFFVTSLVKSIAANSKEQLVEEPAVEGVRS
jgi:hypothetical protein